jgi:alpha-galactosidase
MGNLPENEFLFHAATAYATGGLLLSGDDLTQITPQRKAILDKLRPTGVAATFDPDFRMGRMTLDSKEILFALNWDDAPAGMELQLPRPARLRDLFTGEDLGTHKETFRLSGLPGRSARVLESLPA